MNSMMGELSFLYMFVYHLSVRSLIRVLMVVMLPNFRMFSLEMLGRFKTFLMYCVWLFSHMPIALSVAEMVAVCPYSKSGGMKILYRRIIVEGEGP